MSVRRSGCGTVALRQGKSASDDMMERLFNPTVNRKSADVCAARLRTTTLETCS